MHIRHSEDDRFDAGFLSTLRHIMARLLTLLSDLTS